MVHERTGLPVNEIPGASFPVVLLFMLAAALLVLTTAMEPTLALPTLAFLVMVSVTRLLGRRLYRDLADATALRD